MADNNNPVGRLHNILSKARGMGSNVPVRQVWGQVLGVDPADNAQLLQLIAQIILLIREAKQNLQQLDKIDHSIYLRPFDRIEQAFASLNLDAQWEPYQRLLDESTMYGLEFGADLLARARGEPVLNEEELEQLAELQDEIQSLMEDVLQAEIGKEVQTFIIEGLEYIRTAILEYRIRGVAGLRRAFDQNLGIMMRRQEEIWREKDNELVTKFLLIMRKLSGLARVGLQVKQLAAPVVELLGGGKS